MKKTGFDWRWIVAIVVAMMGFGAAGWYGYASYESRPQFEYVKVGHGPMRVTLRESALVSPEHRLNIMPPIPGRMDTILVANGEAVKQGQVLAWISSTSRAALMDAARAQGGKELKFWEDIFKPAPLVAPLDGHIISTAVVPGQVVVTAQPVFTMSDHLIVEAFVDETDLSQAWLGQEVDITFDSYPDAHLTGKVHEIAVRSGVSANVFLLISDRPDVLKIPTNAISPEGTVLVAQGADQSLEERRIEVGSTDGEWTEVKSGLVEGDWLARRAFDVKKADNAGFSFTSGMNNMHHH